MVDVACSSRRRREPAAASRLTRTPITDSRARAIPARLGMGPVWGVFPDVESAPG